METRVREQTCCQVHKVLVMALKGFKVALRVLGDQPIAEARHVLANVLCHDTLQQHILQDGLAARPCLPAY